ncbi:MAG: YciI family protein [Steroidobacter sp.]
MSGESRRTFIGMSLSAVGVELMGRAPPVLDSVYLVIYRPGEQWLAGQPLEAQPLRDHGRYMLQLYREGTLRYAGRFEDGSGGAAVFAAADDAAANRVVEKDPAVVSRVFAYDLKRWIWVDWGKLRPATGG